ncbi:hypothetical protein FVA74_11285 [Salinibacterium sp. dk2585]|uniref:hypothetical protein n=1 Tax=unclassified Salinibacterium TaxID=2632331 RepID=UPI0011C24D03|nr:MULTISPECIES: hypothetical protein [unclassified Salinibacterium]QEE62085.1 hypothetical protein FVA74_11285 [Salinibacterium sp. dk2585]TXK53437.1 hypothetical protein FVP63_09555 [Salinibacterium sp. dk5596]
MESSRQRHAVRGFVAATVATFVALLSHVLGGGDVPGWLGILAPWVLSLPMCMGLARWTLSLGRLSVSVGVSQFFFHTLFVLGASGGSASFVTSGVGHGSHGLVLVAAESSAAASAYDPAVMWLWHGVAAVITIAAVQRGESALASIRRVAAWVASWVAARVTPAQLAPVAMAPGRMPTPQFSTASLSACFAFSPLLRRGPPLALTPAF